MISQHIRDLRKDAGLSQEQMAQKIGVSRQAVTRWETGLGTPDLDNVVAIADLFGVTVDELLREGSLEAKGEQPEPDPQSSSITQCDVFSPRDFDINYGNAKTVRLTGTQSNKIRVTLQSDAIEGVENSFKVRLDPDGKNFDIDVVATGESSAAQARASLDISIEVPAAWENHIELQGNADTVSLCRLAATGIEVGGKYDLLEVEDVIGHVESDTSQDVRIVCKTMPARLDVNQISATSLLYVPADVNVALRKRGFGNHFVVDGIAQEEGAEYIVELNGMKSELTVRTLAE